MFLDSVWSALSEDHWISAEQLRDASGADEQTLRRVVDFLVRWNFAEARREPSLRVKRRADAISPTDVVQVLNAARDAPETKANGPNGLYRRAERVACRTCGGRSLRETGENEVECTTCHERQWRAIDVKRGIAALEQQHLLQS